MRFASVGGKWRPTCADALACKGREKDPPGGEFWLDAKDCPPADPEPEAAPVVGVNPTFSNLFGEDGLVYCFDCKPVGMAAVEPAEEACSVCGE
jgi:hypothetical protein